MLRKWFKDEEGQGMVEYGLIIGLIAVVVILVLSASMSTLSGLVLTSSSTITLDLIAPLTKKEFGEKKKMLTLRSFVAFFIIVSAVIAILQDVYGFAFIAQLMGVSWGALAGCFLAPFLYGLYWRKTTKAAVGVSFAFGTVFMLSNFICQFTGTTFITPMLNSPLNAGVVAMLFGLVLVPAVTFITPKMDKKEVDAMFSCYDERITVSVKRSLNNK